MRLDVDDVDEEEHGDKGGVASHKEKGSDKDRKIRPAAQSGKLKTKPAFYITSINQSGAQLWMVGGLIMPQGKVHNQDLRLAQVGVGHTWRCHDCVTSLKSAVEDENYFPSFKIIF